MNNDKIKYIMGLFINSYDEDMCIIDIEAEMENYELLNYFYDEAEKIEKLDIYENEDVLNFGIFIYYYCKLVDRKSLLDVVCTSHMNTLLYDYEKSETEEDLDIILNANRSLSEKKKEQFRKLAEIYIVFKEYGLDPGDENSFKIYDMIKEI